MAVPMHFQLCTCEEYRAHPHGYFYTTTSQRQLPMPFYSQTAAQAFLAALPIPEADKAAIASEITATQLPEAMTDEDRAVIKMVAAVTRLTSLILMTALAGSGEDDQPPPGDIPPGTTVH